MLKRKRKLTSDMGYSADQDGNYIIAGTRITGDILSENNILIEGEIMGNISCKGKVTVEIQIGKGKYFLLHIRNLWNNRG